MAGEGLQKPGSQRYREPAGLAGKAAVQAMLGAEVSDVLAMSLDEGCFKNRNATKAPNLAG
jgi:hypothetical protein